jgi:hypothetical protein
MREHRHQLQQQPHLLLAELRERQLRGSDQLLQAPRRGVRQRE